MTEIDLETRIQEWRRAVTSRATVAGDVDELESHLRDRIDEFTRAGLTPDEAFLIAVKRMGAVDELSAEFAREHSDRLWKQLLPPAPQVRAGAGLAIAIGFAVLAGLVVKLPSLWDTASGGELFGDGPLAVIDAALLVLAALGAYFAVRTRPRPRPIIAVAAALGATIAALHLYPFVPEGSTWMLALLHAPIVGWLAICVLYAGGRWADARARMDVIRFTGEWVVYYVLIALGGGVLLLLTIGLFETVGVDVVRFAQEWLLPCGAAGAVVIAAWLVEAKQAVIENIAPVLTKVFTPLFTVLLLALIVVGLLQGSLVDTDRDLLILFDATLLVVVGLLLYAHSARDPLAPAGWFDRLQILLVTSAIAVDLLVLIAMLERIGAYGASPNKVASLGLNVLLLVNLVGVAWLQSRFVLGRTPFASIERWQTTYLPLYLAWAAVVVFVLPPAFGFI